MNKPTATPRFSRPAFVIEARKQFDALIAAHPHVKFVDAVLADIHGVPRGKRLPVAEAVKLFETGMQITHSIYLMDARGEMTNPFGRGFGDGDPDGTAWPIPGTITMVWGDGPPRAQMMMTLRDDDGGINPGEPRAVLERVLERFADLKLTPVTALELEFYLVDPKRDESGAPQPPLCPRTGERESSIQVYGMDDLNRYDGFFAALNEAAEAQNIPLSATSSEYAPGQFEANLKHQKDAVVAADHAVFLKQIVRAAARSQNFHATFMAKPYADRAGTGLHVHLSLLDSSGRNIFDDGSDAGSEQLRHAIGGLQALMPESMALFAPSVNSYRRFQPDMFAPVNRRWGLNNRSVGMRIPVGPCDARRVEHRVSGADANPYLVLAAILAGVHHGMTNKIDPGSPAETNVSREPDMSLPFNIDDALSRLLASEILADYFTAETVKLYAETKRIETQRFRKVMSAAEYDWYL
ncbi:MAG TPA: glutamine synthetase family protein [Rhizomicrobium sp.]|nr:glutamine synthetase family protein [Rhizomicrobium sp.]